MKTITVTVTAVELETLRRALAGLVADERARFPGRDRRSRREAAAERLLDKLFPNTPGGAA